MYCGPAADGAGDTAGVNHDLYSDTSSIADSDVSFTTSTKSSDSRFTRSTGYVVSQGLHLTMHRANMLSDYRVTDYRTNGLCD